MKKTFAHIPFSILTDAAEGRHPLNEPDQEHLQACPRCTAELQWIAQAIGTMRSDQGELPPPEVLAKVKQLGKRLPKPARQPLLQRLRAQLQFDSAQAPLAFGIRAGASGGRQMIFEAGSHIVDLRFRPQGAQWNVAGQLLGADAVGSVELAGAVTIADELTDTSEFSLLPVPSGTYTLTLKLNNYEITFPDFELP